MPIRRSLAVWTTDNRVRYDCSKLRCPSDVTDEEWALIAALIPRAKRGGNPGLERLEPLLHGLEVMAQPDATDAKGRDLRAALLQVVRGPAWPQAGSSM